MAAIKHLYNEILLSNGGEVSGVQAIIATISNYLKANNLDTAVNKKIDYFTEHSRLNTDLFLWTISYSDG